MSRTEVIVIAACAGFAVGCGSSPERPPADCRTAGERGSPTGSSEAAATAPVVESPGDCVEALLARDDMRARGYGPSHPQVRALEARLSSCPQPVVPSKVACAKLHRDRAALATTHGPRHPAIIALDAKLEHCNGSGAAGLE